MANRFIDGAEHYTSLGLVFSASVGAAVSALAARTGSAGIRISASSTGVFRAIGASPATVIAGVAVRYFGRVSNALNIISFYDGTTHQVGLYQLADGSVQVQRNGTVLATSASGALPSSTSGGPFAYVEFKATINDTTGSFAARINGVAVTWASGSASGVDTKNTANAYATQVAFGGRSASSGEGCDIDDLYINDTTGSVAADNDFWGDTEMLYTPPTGAGTYQESTPTGDATNRYANVDETGAPVTTDYNTLTAAGQRDTFTHSRTVGGTATVRAIGHVLHADKDAAGSGTVAAMLRTGGSDALGADISPTANSPATFLSLFPLNPVTGSAWMPSEATALEFGYKKTT